MFGGGFRGFGGFGGMQDEEEEQRQQPKKEVDTMGYYNLIGVDKKATTQQIRKAFRKKALKQHPDKGGDPDKFKLLTHAYDVLTNPEKRQLYDDYGQQGVQSGGPPGGSGFDIFDMFKRKQSGPRKGKPRLITLQVTLQQIYSGCMKIVKVERTRNCQTCDGKGGQNVTKCTKCKGRGAVEKLVQLGPGMYTQTSQKCPDCKATGQIMKEQDRCKDCKGEKIKKVQRQLQVAIEAGCPNKHDYIFTGQSDQYPGIIAGDIYVRVEIKKHKTFIRKGADLAIIKNITLLEALSGVTMQIERLDGKKFVLATAPGEILSNNQFKVIKRLGMPFYKDPMSYGNLIIEFKIQFPKKNFFSKDKIDKIINILGKQNPKGNQKKDPKKSKLLEDFSQADLNPSASGGHQQQQQRHTGGTRQQVQCQQQ